MIIRPDVFPALDPVGVAVRPIFSGIHRLAVVDCAVDRGDVVDRQVDAGDDFTADLRYRSGWRSRFFHRRLDVEFPRIAHLIELCNDRPGRSSPTVVIDRLLGFGPA